MLNREGLDILVHPLTDDMVEDHTVHALSLGAPIKAQARYDAEERIPRRAVADGLTRGPIREERR
jgi:aromatic ring-cleaving dioxygenase